MIANFQLRPEGQCYLIIYSFRLDMAHQFSMPRLTQDHKFCLIMMEKDAGFSNGHPSLLLPFLLVLRLQFVLKLVKGRIVDFASVSFDLYAANILLAFKTMWERG